MSSILNSKAGIQLENLNLVFNSNYYYTSSWRDAFVQKFSRKSRETRPDFGMLHVLKNISLTAKAGDRIGIIGTNGTGKTSLCRCISGIYQPTSGRVKVSGDLRAVFNASTGFLPELTGRENAELLMNFLFPKETSRQVELEKALEFSEIGKLLETPFKNYSAGMQARLSLSIISSFPSDILILDEVFDGGVDRFFTEKISQRVLSMVNNSGIVLFVSHSAEKILRVCNRLLLLSSGEVLFDGPVEQGLANYHSSIPLPPQMSHSRSAELF